MDLTYLEVDLRTGYLMVDLKFGTALSRSLNGDQASTHGRSQPQTAAAMRSKYVGQQSWREAHRWIRLELGDLVPLVAYQWPWVTTRGLCLGHFHNQCGGRPIQLQQPCQDLIFDGKMGVSWDGPAPAELANPLLWLLYAAMVRVHWERQMDYLQLRLFFQSCRRSSDRLSNATFSKQKGFLLPTGNLRLSGSIILCTVFGQHGVSVMVVS